MWMRWLCKKNTYIVQMNNVGGDQPMYWLNYIHWLLQRRNELLNAIWVAYAQLWEAALPARFDNAVIQLFRQRDAAVDAFEATSLDLQQTKLERDELKARYAVRPLTLFSKLNKMFFGIL